MADNLTERFGVGVVGTGYVGLVTGACLSHLGHRVVCLDKDRKRISRLDSGRIPFYEPALEELVYRSVQHQRLFFAATDGLPRLVGEAQVLFIAVDSPQ